MRAVITGIGILCVLFVQAAGQEGPPVGGAEPKQLSVWMEVKVQESQKVFGALAQADFKAITQSTEKLKTLSALEGFVRRSTPGYRTQLRSFEFAVDEIQQQAKRENIEGAALAFNQLTLSCVNCHKQLRRLTEGVITPNASDSVKSSPRPR